LIKKSAMKVSIIVPVYNVEQYLEDCAQTIINQSYTNLEIILVDDGSSDNSGAICDELAKQDSRILVIHQENKGLSAARNTGLRVAKGDYVFFVDSDDKLFLHSIETLVALAKKFPGVDIVQGNIQRQDGKTRTVNACLIEPEYIDDFRKIREGLISHYPIPAWNKLIRTSLLKDNHIEFFEGIIHEDDLFRWSLHTCANSICFTKEFTYWYRTDNTLSIMHESDKTKSICSKLAIISNVSGSIRTRKEYGFAFRMISYENKAKILPYCKNPKIVLQEIDKLLKKSDFPFLLKAELALWHLPIQLLKNSLFMFPYRVLRKCVLSLRCHPLL